MGSYLCAAVGLLLAITVACGDELWERDVTDEMGIGVAETGYRQVLLRCSADEMKVEMELEEDFDGVIYTRGAYYQQEKPCFLDATGGHNFSLNIPLDKCNTKHDNGLYSNTLVIQYDDELIMPGDAAFRLECDFRSPKDVTVSADLAGGRSPIQTRITLEDADPAAKEQPRQKRSVVSSSSDTVTFTPGDAKTQIKDEL